MNSAELSEHVEDIVAAAQARITGIGKSQYEEFGIQKFETLTMTELLGMLEEELLDQINYSVMNILRIRGIAKMFELITDDAEIVSDLVRMFNDSLKGSQAKATLESLKRQHGS